MTYNKIIKEKINYKIAIIFTILSINNKNKIQIAREN